MISNAGTDPTMPGLVGSRTTLPGLGRPLLLLPGRTERPQDFEQTVPLRGRVTEFRFSVNTDRAVDPTEDADHEERMSGHAPESRTMTYVDWNANRVPQPFGDPRCRVCTFKYHDPGMYEQHRKCENELTPLEADHSSRDSKENRWFLGKTLEGSKVGDGGWILWRSDQRIGSRPSRITLVRTM